MVAVVDGREFIDDSKATNLHALESCLRALPDPVVLIAGGKDKGLDFSPLRELVAERTTHVLALGQLRAHLADVWHGAVPVEACDSLEAAVVRASPSAVRARVSSSVPAHRVSTCSAAMKNAASASSKPCSDSFPRLTPTHPTTRLPNSP